MRALQGGLLVAALSCLASCTGVRYVTQAAAGQYDLLDRARPIDLLVSEDRVNGRTKRLLEEVSHVKRFGEAHGLRATANYTRYVRINRPAVVWVVSASEPLRFRSKVWSFPLVGSFTFLGWFKRPEADSFGEELRAEGWDVDVRGAGAYSTTGYFDDPVLSTMLAQGADALGDLVNTILHESAHATVFVKNQSTLCESVASFVGDHLAETYLDETVGHESPEARAYRATEERKLARSRVMHAAYEELEAIYTSAASDSDKMRRKRETIDRLKADLHIKRPIGNATLIQYRTYNSGQAELSALFDACGRDWPRFIAELKTLETAPLKSAQQHDLGELLRPLIDARCAASR